MTGDERGEAGERGEGDGFDEAGRRRWIADEGAAGRLDVHVAGRLGLSRTRAAALVADGRVLVDGRAAKKSEPVCEGQRLEVEVPAPVPIKAEPQDIPVRIVHQDRDLVVVDKPAGLVVHPAPGHPDRTLVNALLHHVGDLAGIGGALRPGIVHRLDKDTSGLMVAAKTDRAHRGLSEALEERRVERRYVAALWGRLAESPVVVDRPVGRHPKDRARMAVVAGGRPARTRFRAVEEWRTACFCEARLDTGRTHQIRVHASALGHPVVGDATYGAGRERGFSGPGLRWAAELAKRTPRQFLHAARLAFSHPVSGRPMTFEAPLPPELAEVREWALEASSRG